MTGKIISIILKNASLDTANRADLVIVAGCDIYFDFDVAEDAAAYELHLSYCRNQFGEGFRYQPSRLNGRASFGFARERDAVQFVCWTDRQCQNLSQPWVVKAPPPNMLTYAARNGRPPR